jgi:hypothetical protein
MKLITQATLVGTLLINGCNHNEVRNNSYTQNSPMYNSCVTSSITVENGFSGPYLLEAEIFANMNVYEDRELPAVLEKGWLESIMGSPFEKNSYGDHLDKLIEKESAGLRSEYAH